MKRLALILALTTALPAHAGGPVLVEDATSTPNPPLGQPGAHRDRRADPLRHRLPRQRRSRSRHPARPDLQHGVLTVTAAPEPGYSGPAVFPMVLFCATCGTVLQVRRGGQVPKEAREQIDRAARFNYDHAEAVAILPCQACIESQTAPARALTKALADLVKA